MAAALVVAKLSLSLHATHMVSFAGSRCTGLSHSPSFSHAGLDSILLLLNRECRTPTSYAHGVLCLSISPLSLPLTPSLSLSLFLSLSLPPPPPPPSPPYTLTLLRRGSALHIFFSGCRPCDQLLSWYPWNSPAGRLLSARVTGHADAEARRSVVTALSVRPAALMVSFAGFCRGTSLIRNPAPPPRTIIGPWA
ncbi:hypothetical protein T484DRAFT_3204611 [Baffinella frigidus]|nr:hypothetical protein T484DRAFT_3204611 [Cryptophyta sp. CCMP2293]